MELEHIAVYDTIQSNEGATESIYELPEISPAAEKEDCSMKYQETSVKQEKKNYGFNFFITIFAAIILMLTLISLIFSLTNYRSLNQPQNSQQNMDINNLQSHLNSSSEAQSSELTYLHLLVQTLHQQLNDSAQQSQEKRNELERSLQSYIQVFIEKRLNDSASEIQMQISDLQDHILSVERQQNSTITSVKNCLLPSSCKDLPQDSQSGLYQIETGSGIIQVYCDINPRNCTCNSTGGWMRVANIDMTDPNQQCPEEFKLINRTEPPLRTCGRPVGSGRGCVSTTFPVHGIQYSHVCGRIIGYQIGPTIAFHGSGIDSNYIDGIGLTYGLSPRQHIWSFVSAVNEVTPHSFHICPCTRNHSEAISVPQFIGNDYFCDSASGSYSHIFFADDPLWDGQGCPSVSTCCEFNTPPWFCKQLPQPTTEDIELRICNNHDSDNDDTPFEIVEMYVK